MRTGDVRCDLDAPFPILPRRWGVARWRVALGLLLVPLEAWAYRPFISTDAAVADPQEVEVELGYFTLERTQGMNVFTLPSLVLSYGLLEDVEIVGELRIERDPTDAVQGVDPRLFLKAVLKEGLLQGKTLADHFDQDPIGKLPAHFHLALTGKGPEGAWGVKPDETAPSKPNVLAQTSTDRTDYRFPMAILDEGSFQDLDLSVKFKAVSGEVDQAAGLVFRYRDSNHYYVVRANALEDNYRLYHVVNGRRQQFAGTKLHVTPNQWHTLHVECVGNQIKCYYDGEIKITATDETFKDAGKVGLWTKVDSVTYFDDFTVTAK